MTKRISSFILALILLISLIPGTVFAASDDRNGWVKEANGWYYYKDDERVTGWKKIGGKWYYMDAESAGRMVDFPSYYIGGKIYVFNRDGSLVSKKGWTTISFYDQSFKFYVKSDGTAYAINSWRKIGGKWYYFVDVGYVITEAWVPNGIEIDGKMCYFNNDGSWKFNCWHNYKDNWYYLGSDGQPVTGWKKIGGKWYYFDPHGNVMLDDAWLQDSKDPAKWYRLGEDGAMITNKWIQKMDIWYYMTSDGSCALGWKKLGGKWYYFRPDEAGMCVIDAKGFNIDGRRYDFDSNGVCTTPKGY